MVEVIISPTFEARVLMLLDSKCYVGLLLDDLC